ncbi:MAG: lipocalin family protein [Bacteriovorax sp.]|nr:lipocalin family protein [Bacteriovorax sp.]
MKFFLLLALLFSVGAFAKKPAPLPVESKVDVARYAGKWFTIASLPQFYTSKCTGQTAEYGVLNEKEISVHNVCFEEKGKTKDINGFATIQNAPANSKLLVQFDKKWTKLFKVKGDYQIIKLSDNYDSVMVGSNDRKSLWIMSRTTALDPQAFLDYKKLANDLGFSVMQLRDAKY